MEKNNGGDAHAIIGFKLHLPSDVAVVFVSVLFSVLLMR